MSRRKKTGTTDKQISSILDDFGFTTKEDCEIVVNSIKDSSKDVNRWFDIVWALTTSGRKDAVELAGKMMLGEKVTFD